MYIKRKRRYKRKTKKGKGALLESDWPRIRKTLQPFLNSRKKKQIGKGTWQKYKNSVFW